MGKILYSAIVLDEKSKSKLLEKVGQLIPKGWTVYAHHMTIKLGELRPEQKRLVGLKVRLTINEFGRGEKVIAVKAHTDGIQSDNATPHITIAVDTVNGGKSAMSNQITKWYNIERPLLLTGVVTEIF